MKKLRVLTGRHAGSDLTLDASTCSISNRAEDDIQITDWSETPITLHIHEDGTDNPPAAVRLDEEGPDVMLEDFLPRAFGSVVLCVGPVNAAWPADIALLERMMRPPVQEPDVSADDRVAEGAAQPRRFRLYAGAATCAVAMLAAFVAVLRPERPAVQPSPLALAMKVLQKFDLPEVSARSDGPGAIVEGLVPDTATANRLRQALATLPPGLVKDRIASASDIAQTITDTFAEADLSVRYAGSGRFLVQGSVVGAGRLSATADRLVNELKPLVSAITVAVKDLPPPPRMPTGAMMSAAGVAYVQGRDGTKHIALVHRQETDPIGGTNLQFPQPANDERSRQ